MEHVVSGQIAAATQQAERHGVRIHGLDDGPPVIGNLIARPQFTGQKGVGFQFVVTWGRAAGDLIAANAAVIANRGKEKVWIGGQRMGMLLPRRLGVAAEQRQYFIFRELGDAIRTPSGDRIKGRFHAVIQRHLFQF